MEFKLKNGKTVVTRPLTADDAESAVNYLQQLAEETIYTMQYPDQPKKDVEKSKKVYTDPNNFFRGVFDGDRVVGIASCIICDPAHPWADHVADFGISLLNEYQGGGIAKSLMDEMDVWAKSKGVRCIEARVRAGNNRAIKLYVKCGFKIEGLHKNRAIINGTWYDEYTIAKFLD